MVNLNKPKSGLSGENHNIFDLFLTISYFLFLISYFESMEPVLNLHCKERTSSDLYAVQAASRRFRVSENRSH